MIIMENKKRNVEHNDNGMMLTRDDSLGCRILDRNNITQLRRFCSICDCVLRACSIAGDNDLSFIICLCVNTCGVRTVTCATVIK